VKVGGETACQQESLKGIGILIKKGRFVLCGEEEIPIERPRIHDFIEYLTNRLAIDYLSASERVSV
jgi:hypothetical protein